MTAGRTLAGRRSQAPSWARRRAELGRALEHALFGFVPAVALVALIVFAFSIHEVAVDLRVAYWPAAHRLLNGGSPYAVTHHQIVNADAFVYPALSALVFAPFALVSNGVAQVLYALVCLACIPAILYTLNVRDWRIYGPVLLWSPVFEAWESGNVTLPLALAVALTWRHRNRPVVAGLITAAAISLKPFVWPLALWLLATRRWRAATWALVSGLLINLLAWGILGYNEIHVYLNLSREVTNALWRGGYSMMALGGQLGLGRGASEGLLVIASVVAAGALLYTGLIKRNERNALVLAVVLMLLASPLVWSHYFALLLIPLALSRPRLSPAWGFGLLMWPVPPRANVAGWQEALAWVITALCVAIALGRKPTRGMRTRDVGSGHAAAQVGIHA